MTRHREVVDDALLRQAGVLVASSSVIPPTVVSGKSPRGGQMSNDPWIHRSKGMQCRTCMWYVEKVPSVEKVPMSDTDPRGFGRCRRHAPTMNGYPAVFSTDWCGDHKLDENKL
jgi:hypothetical protein